MSFICAFVCTDCANIAWQTVMGNSLISSLRAGNVYIMHTSMNLKMYGCTFLSSGYYVDTAQLDNCLYNWLIRPGRSSVTEIIMSLPSVFFDILRQFYQNSKDAAVSAKLQMAQI